MQTVSQSWKNNQLKTVVNEAFVDIVYNISDKDLLENITIDATDYLTNSNIEQVLTNTYGDVEKYATLEQNVWCLDGNTVFITGTIDDEAFKGKSYRDIFVVGNIIANGKFDSDVSGWTVVNGTLTWNNGKAVLYNAVTGDTYIHPSSSTTQIDYHYYYATVDVEYLSGNNVTMAFENDWNLRLYEGHNSYIYQESASYFHRFLIDNMGSGMTNVSFDNIYVIDLTDIFGEGNEPTKYQMDMLYQIYLAINSKKGLDDIVFQGKSYRDIFITANKYTTENLTTAENIVNGTITRLGNKLKFDVTPVGASYFNWNYSTIPLNNELFFAFEISENTTGSYISTRINNLNDYNVSTTGLFVHPTDISNGTYFNNFVSYSDVGYFTINTEKLVIIDKTSLFGAGNEPSNLQMKTLYDSYLRLYNNDIGYISNSFSLADKTFTPNIDISLTVNPNFSFTNETNGIKIVFSKELNQYATIFDVLFYDSASSLLHTISVTDNNSPIWQYIIDSTTSGYDNFYYVTIKIKAWSNAGYRARIAQVYLGIQTIYDKKSLVSYSHEIIADPIGRELPRNVLKFEIDNTDQKYNPLNPDGLARFMSERQEIVARYGYMIDNDVEWINGGKFYLRQWDAPQNGSTASFEARDVLEFLSPLYNEGVYDNTSNSGQGKTLYALSSLVWADTNLDDTPVFDTSMAYIYTTNPLPIVSQSESLQLLSNASENIMYVNRDGILHIEPLSSTVNTDYIINYQNSYSKPNLTLDKPTKQIDVLDYNFTASSTASTVFSSEMNTTQNVMTTITIYYDKPATNLSYAITNGTATVVPNYYTYYATIDFTRTSSTIPTLTLTGYELTSAQQIVTTNGAISGETYEISNPLINSITLASNIGAWSKEYLNKRQNVELEWRSDPRLDVFDTIKVQLGTTTYDVLITELNYSFNGSFKAKAKGKVI